MLGSRHLAAALLLLRIRAHQSQTILLDRRLRCFFDRLRGLVPYMPTVTQDAALFADTLHKVELRLSGRQVLVAGYDARSTG